MARFAYPKSPRLGCWSLRQANQLSYEFPFAGGIGYVCLALSTKAGPTLGTLFLIVGALSLVFAALAGSAKVPVVLRRHALSGAHR